MIYYLATAHEAATPDNIGAMSTGNSTGLELAIFFKYFRRHKLKALLSLYHYFLTIIFSDSGEPTLPIRDQIDSWVYPKVSARGNFSHTHPP